MSAIRLPLLCAFAGGCLSSAVLFGLWRADTAAAVAVPTRQQQVTHPPELAKTSNSPRSTELLAEAPLPRPPAPDAKGEASAPKAAADLGNAEPTPAGSAVSDVLTDLEAAYRQRLIAAARAEAAEAATAARTLLAAGSAGYRAGPARSSARSHRARRVSRRADCSCARRGRADCSCARRGRADRSCARRGRADCADCAHDPGSE